MADHKVRRSEAIREVGEEGSEPAPDFRSQLRATPTTKSWSVKPPAPGGSNWY